MTKSFYLILLFISACSLAPKQSHEQVAAIKPAGFTVLAINDVYRLDNLAKVRALRQQLEQQGDVLLLHAGDFLFPSFLSREFNGAQMIDVMNQLDGDASAEDARLWVTFGNHEFDKSQMKHRQILQDRISESQFGWVSSNVSFHPQAAIQDPHLTASKIMTINGIQVGIFGLTINSKIPEYVQQITAPIATAQAMTQQLRQQGAQVVIALTHLTMAQDKQLLQQLGEHGPDIIFGGHEHNQQSAQVNGRYVLKADADAISATVAKISLDGAVLKVDFQFQSLAEIKPDSLVVQRIADWKSKHEQQFCDKNNLSAHCLQAQLGRSQLVLKAEELEIRRFETNLGSWLMDLAVQAYAEQGAQIAFMNSGSLRLNRDIPVDEIITRKTLNELFAYPAKLALIKIKGATLQRVINRAIQDWAGNGHWLQISGFAFRHNPETNTADQLSLIEASGIRPISPDETLLAVVNDFLLDPGKGNQDGYDMLSSKMIINPDEDWPDLREKTATALQQAGEKGIQPETLGRICNTQRAGPCLLDVVYY
ncbi:bifunctional metallophosphatase/5'-nucleotidase [Candidatus Venteria ishoeyi]|uniref:Trifunctional nucleotide phosphoesterase protein YfkN n=1 Tax=Candidatus Venteria ishoeyi TaxID=1899563 RepID=A0A1H6FHP7_9GAMM|nr:5'-nucleotidase C-terminal domain-containing protein [Candidatus Venteria ishoeyi]SEH09173.1 Trifunctional nucleotide phosphoesterase protein YfkN precursor [Candidatus Venteria ishoeyi]SEH09302.1 Trifunctional nucleotide phosphoesterase protein YfkN precursor [Candidatus Venteria ishoeyi]